MKLLIVEDDSAVAAVMDLQLCAEGFNTYTTDLGEEAVSLATNYEYDCVTLDLNLPDMSGVEVLRRLRAGKVTTPVLICSGDANLDTKLKAFGAGADDFLAKPFHTDELVARLHALIRRSKGHAETVLRAGPIEVHLGSKTVEVNGEPVHFTSKEYQVLELLALRKGATITKDMVLNHLYGGMDEPEMKIVDVFICKVRAKLRKHGADGYIHTIWGRGFVLRDETGGEPYARPGLRSPPIEQLGASALALIAERPRSRGELRAHLRISWEGFEELLGILAGAGEIVRDDGPIRITDRGRSRLQALSGQEAA